MIRWSRHVQLSPQPGESGNACLLQQLHECDSRCNVRTVKQPTAKSLILDLASTSGRQPLSASALVQVAAVFGISENNVRVVLARLLARGLLERSKRGLYSLASDASAVQRHVGSWTHVDAKMITWRAQWVGVCVRRTKGRSAKLKRQRRALELLGFRALEPTLLVRPDNLRGGVCALRDRLVELGLGAALVFGLNEFDPITDARARQLWDVEGLDRGYRELRAELARSAEGLVDFDFCSRAAPRSSSSSAPATLTDSAPPSLSPSADVPLDKAVVECFVLGGQVLRLLAYDPLLPQTIHDPAERSALVDEMRRYDRIGRTCWRRRFGLAMPVSPLRSCVVHEPPVRRSSP